jgi:hypothetical protein
MNVEWQNIDGSYSKCADWTNNSFKHDRYENMIKKDISFKTRIICTAVGILLHIGLLKLLTGNKFDNAFSSIIFYLKNILSESRSETFILAHSFEIASLLAGLTVFNKITTAKFNYYLEDKIGEIKRSDFRVICSELAVVHLIIAVMKFVYPLMLNVFNNMSEIFSYEIARFIIAEGVVYTACAVFHLRDFISSFHRIDDFEYFEGLAQNNKVFRETGKD